MRQVLVPLVSRATVGKQLGLSRQMVKVIEEAALYKLVKRLREGLQLDAVRSGFKHAVPMPELSECVLPDTSAESG
jgi:biotin operon repressor